MDIEVRRDRLAELMRARGLSAADLARATGGSESTISLAFSGQRNPSVPTLVSWAQALDCSLDYLVGLSDNPRRAYGQPPPPGGLEILDVMRQLRPEVAAELVRVARAMVAAQQSAERGAVQAIEIAIGQLADADARTLLADALALARAGRGREAMAQVEGYIARLEGGRNGEASHADQKTQSHV